VGIEVEAASPVGQDDVNGLRHLAQRVGDDFIVGLVMYTGLQTLSFGPRVRAMLVSAICEVPMAPWHPRPPRHETANPLVVCAFPT